MFGAAFFQNFFAQFTYTGESSNLVRLSLAEYPAPGTYLGSQTGSISSDDPVPTPEPVVNPPTPTTTPLPTVVNATSSNGNTLNILIVSGETIVAMILVAAIIFLCVNKVSFRKRTTLDEFNTNLNNSTVPFTPQTHTEID